jgi:hypothetical protein
MATAGRLRGANRLHAVNVEDFNKYSVANTRSGKHANDRLARLSTRLGLNPQRARLGGFAALIALLSWPGVPLTPSQGLDVSWMAGLAMAVHRGITFGDHAIFAYGPLGFLTNTYVWYRGLAALAFAYLLVVRLTLALALFLSTRRTFGTAGAFVVSLVAACYISEESAVAIVLIVLVWATTTGLRGRYAVIVACAAGAFAGLELLAKVSIGVAIAAMVIVFVLGLRADRVSAAGAAASGFALTLLILWLLSGQPVATLSDYFKQSEQVVSGYSSAMGLSAGEMQWQSLAAVFALLLGLGGALQTSQLAGLRTRSTVVLLWLAYWFFAFKEGFVRHDTGHTALFFQAMLAGFFAFRWRSTHRASVLVSSAAPLLLLLAANSQPLSARLDIVSNARGAGGQLHAVVIPARARRIIAQGEKSIRASEPIDGQSLRIVGHGTLAPYPYDLVLAWAYGLNWDPIPALQSYQAYTSDLDATDANFLHSAQAPEWILLGHEAGIDGRILSFDQPTTYVTILCRYRERRVTATTDLLQRSPNRCHGLRPLGSVQVDWGQAVTVPSPPDAHSLVLARIEGVQVGGLERLRSLLFKPAERFITVNGTQHRLIEGTAADGLPLSVAGGIDLSPPFSFVPGARTIAVLKYGQGKTGRRPITFSFFAETVSP